MKSLWFPFDTQRMRNDKSPDENVKTDNIEFSRSLRFQRLVLCAVTATSEPLLTLLGCKQDVVDRVL